MRSTRLIDTQYGPMLFSPVLAHSLAPGDLVAPDSMAAGAAWRVAFTRRLPGGELGIEFPPGSKPERLRVGLNQPVMRAVGATVGGLL